MKFVDSTCRATRAATLAKNAIGRSDRILIPGQTFLSDEVARSAPRGRDSRAQGTNLSVGAPALGWIEDKNVKPQRGETLFPFNKKRTSAIDRQPRRLDRFGNRHGARHWPKISVCVAFPDPGISPRWGYSPALTG